MFKIQTLKDAINTNYASGVINGASTGAAAGSIVPGIGTAIGAGIGAILSLVSSIFGNLFQVPLSSSDWDKIFPNIGYFHTLARQYYPPHIKWRSDLGNIVTFEPSFVQAYQSQILGNNNNDINQGVQIVNQSLALEDQYPGLTTPITNQTTGQVTIQYTNASGLTIKPGVPGTSLNFSTFTSNPLILFGLIGAALYMVSQKRK